MTRLVQTRRRPDWVTLPNLITIARLALLVPVCWILLDAATCGLPDVIAPLLLAVWAGTDWADGFLARRLGQTSRAGEILDPVADRIGIAAIGTTLAVTGLLSWWLLAVITGVDLLTAVLAGPAAKRGRLGVSRSGKLRTALLMIGVIGLVSGSTLASDHGQARHTITASCNLVLLSGTVLHALAGLDYIRRARRTP